MQRRLLQVLRAGVLIPVLAVLSGCGGSPSPVVVPLRAALRDSAIAGSSFTLYATGSQTSAAKDGLCSGTMTVTSTPLRVSPTPFNRIDQPWVATTTVTINYTNCTLSTGRSDSIDVSTDYYDSNFLSIGTQSQSAYGYFALTPVIPDMARVGTVGTIGRINFYTDSSKVTALGYADKTFVIEPESSTTAIANAITKTYDTHDTLISVAQVRYRVDVNGAFTLYSEDIEVYSPNPGHYVFRAH